VIRIDCGEYTGNAPCRFHKLDGRGCHTCRDYTAQAERILVIKLGALGDVLRTTAILPGLRRRYPGCHITWVTRSSSSPLLDGNPLIDRVLCIEQHYLEFILTESFDVSICLDTEPLAASISTLARCDERRGFMTDRAGRVHPANTAAMEWWMMGVDDRLKRANRKTFAELMYQMCGLDCPSHTPVLSLDAEAARWAARFVSEAGFPKGAPIVAINLGGSDRWEEKKWTPEHYGELVNSIGRLSPEVGVLLLGGPSEQQLYSRIMAESSHFIVGSGCDRSLHEFAALIDASDLLVTSDSLGLHIAVARGKLAVVLVGPTSPWELSVNDRGVILHADVECIACYQARCPKPVTCMQLLRPDSVVAEVVKLLSKYHSWVGASSPHRHVSSELSLTMVDGEPASRAPQPAREDTSIGLAVIAAN
jgi:ADP-heptose:LPS heptosyltransferase